MTAGVWDPTIFGAAGDYTTDDTAAIQAAIDTCSASGGGVVQLGQHVVSGAGLTPMSGVYLAGTPGYSKLAQLTDAPVISSSVDCSNIGFRDFIIEGPITETVTVPTRARTAAGPGATMGIWLDGSLDPTSTGVPVITDVVIRNVTVIGTTSLPIRIFGVGGRVLVEGCSFVNCLDAGFAYNEEVQLLGCHSLMSQDNGFSISRGNTKVVCVGNTAELAAYNGIWLAGFQGATGPTDLTCTGNTVRNVGNNGIYLDGAPSTGTVTGNLVDGVARGPIDQPTDVNSAGIFVGGNPVTSRAAPTNYATGLTISGNTVRNAARAGIYVTGCQHVTVVGNTLLDIGSEYLADGATAIAATDTTQNVGVLVDYPTTVSDVTVALNTVADTRATPYCNYALVPSSTAGVAAYLNTGTNLRQPQVLPDTGPTRTWQATQTYLGHQVAVGAPATVSAGVESASATAGSNGCYDGAGTVNTTALAVPLAGTIATVTYANPYGAIPKVALTARNAATVLAGIYTTAESTTGFSIATTAAPAAGAALSVSYHVKG